MVPGGRLVLGPRAGPRARHNTLEGNLAVSSSVVTNAQSWSRVHEFLRLEFQARKVGVNMAL